MTEHIKKNGRIYVIETGYGFNPDNSEVRVYDGTNEFGQLVGGEFIFCGTWDECEEYVNSL